VKAIVVTELLPAWPELPTKPRPR